MLNKATENQNNNQLTSHLHTFLSTNNCSDALKILNETNQDFPVGSALLLIACSHGKTEVVKFLLLGKQTNKEADNALKFSSMNGKSESVKLLFEKNANIEAKTNDGWTPLLYASSNGHSEVVKLLLN